MSATNIVIAIAAQTASAIRDIDGVNNALGRQMTQAEKVKSGFQKMAGPAAAAFAAVGAGALVAVRSAEEAAATSAKLQQVYESMGYADLADDAERYAEALSKQIGVDDDVIKGAQTKLATFSEIAKSADLMGEATSIAADLSAAGFGSMDSAAVMLGKALQDPVKGMNAMARVGVTFTDQQKEQIKAMVAAGDTAGAQAIIMGALKEQVGGVAEAGATSSQKLSVAFGEISESVGASLLPAFEGLMEPLQKFADWAAENPEIITAIGGTILVLAGAVLAVNAAIAIWTAVGTIATAVTSAFGIAVAVATSPITLIVLAIAAVIAIGVLLVKNWDDISAWLKNLWNSIKATATSVWNSIKDFFANTWNSIKRATTEAWEAVKTAVTTGISNVVGFVREMPGKILSAIGNFVTLLFQKGVDLIQGFIKGYLSIWGTVLSFAGDLIGKVAGAVGNAGSALFNKGKDLIQGFINGIKSMAGRILDAILGIIPGPVRSIVSGALGLGRSGGVGRSYSPGFYGGSSRAMSRSAVINLYGDPVSNERAVKRALEGYDISMGRAPGQPLARAW
jgi:phage-related protein